MDLVSLLGLISVKVKYLSWCERHGFSLVRKEIVFLIEEVIEYALSMKKWNWRYIDMQY